MLDYVIGIVEGMILGAALYLCVRVRVKFGPLALSRYGQWARSLVWVLSILLMIVIANLGLVLFRTSLLGLVAHKPSLVTEACFAITGLVTGCLLVLRRYRGETSEDACTKV